MVDPAPFLSTIAAASAAMVAIVGGLLVARFVTIASEQDGAQQLLDDAEGRLETAQNREQELRGKLYNWDVSDFFDTKVLWAMGGGKRDIKELREVGGYTSLTDDQLAEAVQSIATEFDKAGRLLRELVASSAEDNDHPDWKEFKRSKKEQLPTTNWDEVWEIAYKALVSPPRPGRRSLLPDYGVTPLSFAPTIPEYVALEARRRDDLRADIERAKQQVEDIAGEVARLQRARDAIVRPKGLGWGLVVLSFFTAGGVIIPIWLMSRAPRRLTAHLGEVVFWLFLAGLLALLGYMVVLALRLSGWRRRRQGQSREGGTRR